jgi:hypothetical protein
MIQHGGGIEIIEAGDFHLRGSPAEKRAVVTQDFVFHKTDMASTENQKQFSIFQVMIDYVLEDRRQHMVSRCGIRKLVNGKDDSSFTCFFRQEFQALVPIFG